MKEIGFGGTRLNIKHAWMKICPFLVHIICQTTFVKYHKQCLNWYQTFKAASNPNLDKVCPENVINKIPTVQSVQQQQE